MFYRFSSLHEVCSTASADTVGTTHETDSLRNVSSYINPNLSELEDNPNSTELDVDSN